MRWFLFTVDADWVPGSDTGLRALLALCADLAVKTTIFATGNFTLAYPDVILAAAQAGHEIGVHGWEHPMPTFRHENYRFTPVEVRRRWLSQATEAIAQVAGKPPRSFRAPFLWTDAETFGLLENLGYAVDSSIPTRRFDGLVGMVNHLEYFWASLEPYHPDRQRPGRKGHSPILEIPPSAYLLPLNMSTLRFFGLRHTSRLAGLIASRSSVLNFYCHPWEFVPPSELHFAPGTPGRHTQAVGPHWLGSLRDFLEGTLARGYRTATVSEVVSCGSWS